MMVKAKMNMSGWQFAWRLNAGLVMFKGAKVRSVIQRTGKPCVADEAIMKARVADIKRGLHMLICTPVLSDLRLM